MIFKQKQTGFTLIELMIAVVIIGIISAIAYPSYTNYVLKTHRAQAKVDLTELANYMERYYSENMSYNDTTNPPVLPFTQSPKQQGKKAYYQISFSAGPTASTYTLQAVPQGGQTNDRCGTLTLDQTGTGTAKTGGAAVANCWQ